MIKISVFAISVSLVIIGSANVLAGTPVPLPTNGDNFFMRGTQPNQLAPGNEIVTGANDCIACHSGNAPIYDEWAGSLMANAARDPVFYACLDIANADAPGSGDICIRCHVPKAWLEGRSTPTDGSMITQADRDGINCNFCHRMVDPFNVMGDAPAVDTDILAALGADAPVQSMDQGMPSSPGFSGSASYVIDPYDRRRGPFPLGNGPGEADCENFHFQDTFNQCVDDMGMPVPCPTYESPFHRRSQICSTCHDVSTPHFSLNMAGTGFEFNGTGVQHPDGNKYNMVPIERTFSEWLKSDFAVGSGVDLGGRFGGPNATFVADCQDCHMPVYTAQGCQQRAPRADLPHHFLSGASTWQLEAIKAQYGDTGTKSPGEVSDAVIDTNIQRNIKMLRCAADLEVTLDDSQTPGIDQLKVRVVNQTGHKLPSGYPEGRRIWVTVQFFDCTDANNPSEEYGAYDFDTGDLVTANTKVYEMKGGLDSHLAALTNRTAGPDQHFVLTNTIFKDNRIPPRGFTNVGFAAVQASPVAYSYADGQYWDDTFFDIPAYAIGVKVMLYYQATTKEYIEFLRDENPDFGMPGNAGQEAYDLWLSEGGRIPVEMAIFPPRPVPLPDDPCDETDPAILYACDCPDGPDPLVVDPDGDGQFDVELKGDLDGDRQVTIVDLPSFVQVLLGNETDARLICAADMNDLNGAGGEDIQLFVDELLAP